MEELANLSEHVYVQAVADGLGEEAQGQFYRLCEGLSSMTSEREPVRTERMDVGEEEIEETKRKLEESKSADKTKLTRRADEHRNRDERNLLLKRRVGYRGS